MASESDVQDLVAAYWRYWRGSEIDRRRVEGRLEDPTFAAQLEVGRQVRRGGQSSLELIDALLSAADSDDEIVIIGDGPLSELLWSHASELSLEIATRAERDTSFQLALDQVDRDTTSLDAMTLSQLAPWVRSIREELYSEGPWNSRT